jgi:hypothetical protein
MNLLTLATGVFFLSAGINYLVSNQILAVIAGISGIIAGLIILAGGRL